MIRCVVAAAFLAAVIGTWFVMSYRPEVASATPRGGLVGNGRPLGSEEPSDPAKGEQQLVEELTLREALGRVQIQLTKYHLASNHEGAVAAAKDLSYALDKLEETPRMKKGLAWMDFNIDAETLNERPRSTKNWAVTGGTKWDKVSAIDRVRVQSTVHYRRMRETLKRDNPVSYDHPYTTAFIEVILDAGK